MWPSGRTLWYMRAVVCSFDGERELMLDEDEEELVVHEKAKAKAKSW